MSLRKSMWILGTGPKLKILEVDFRNVAADFAAVLMWISPISVELIHVSGV